ncbi:MAG: DUF975 family protein, partial [Patescibacteria group bacterium]
MNAKTFVKEHISFGWETFKKRPWIFVSAFLVVLAVLAVESILESPFHDGAMESVASLINWIISSFVGMGLVSFALKAEKDAASVSLRDLWAPTRFWKYLLLTLVTMIILVPAYILLIVPGIFLSVCFVFAPYLVVDKGLGPIEALKASWSMTKGHRWNLFFLGLAAIGLSIVGFVFLFVGLLVTTPVIMLAMAH